MRITAIGAYVRPNSAPQKQQGQQNKVSFGKEGEYGVKLSAGRFNVGNTAAFLKGIGVTPLAVYTIVQDDVVTIHNDGIDAWVTLDKESKDYKKYGPAYDKVLELYEERKTDPRYEFKDRMNYIAIDIDHEMWYLGEKRRKANSSK